MSAKTAAAVILMLAGLIPVLSRAAGKSAITLDASTPQGVHSLAQNLIDRFGFNVTAGMATAIAIVESGDVDFPQNGLNVYASRYEAGIQDTSTGLMQTLTGTAQWLARDMGYDAFGIPDAAALYNPETSMYFGLSYLDYLSKYKGVQRSEGYVVQSYNAGPGHTASFYLTKYQRAKTWLQNNGVI